MHLYKDICTALFFIVLGITYSIPTESMKISSSIIPHWTHTHTHNDLYPDVVIIFVILVFSTYTDVAKHMLFIDEPYSVYNYLYFQVQIFILSTYPNLNYVIISVCLFG